MASNKRKQGRRQDLDKQRVQSNPPTTQPTEPLAPLGHPPHQSGYTHAEPVERTTVTRASWEGPLPPPALLAAYNQIIPNLSERLVARYESEGVHRQTMESTVIAAQIEDVRAERAQHRRGQFLGAIVVLASLAASTIMTCFGHATAGGTLAGTTIVALAGIFVLGRKPAQAKDQPVEKSN